MTVRWDATKVNGSAMPIYAAIPERAGALPGIIVAQHAPGLDAEMQDVAHRLHREGYAVAIPQLFHRQAADIDPSKRGSLVIDSEIIDDLKAAIAYLKTHAKIAPLGMLGYCMGGRISMMAAAAFSEFKAAAAFYPSNMKKPFGSGPTTFERLRDIKCPVIAFFGTEDANIPMEMVHAVDEEMTRHGKWHEFHTYRDAPHAFSNFGIRERYRERPARAAWTETLAFFDEHLRGGAA